jgi:plasmid stabilization system protein ParE
VAAVRHLREIIERARCLLGDFPQTGRRGQTPGTRRLVVAPYILTYRELGGDVVLVDIRHSRQAERPIPEEG